MAGKKLLNLDALVPEDRYFKLGEQEYRVPGTLSVAEAMKIAQAAQKQDEKKPASVMDALDVIWGVLEPHNPEAKREKFIGAMKVSMISPLFDFVFNAPQGGEATPLADGGVVDNSKNGSGR